MKPLRRWLILVHRYLGIGIGLLVMVWFASGIVMIYAGEMPRLTPRTRLELLPPLDLSHVQISPAEAVRRLDGSGRLRLLRTLDRPVYRLGDESLFADTGQAMSPLSTEQTRRVATGFAGVAAAQVSEAEVVTAVDQWTLDQRRALPLHRFRVDDRAATELYVRPLTGEVVTLTTRGSRVLAWTGAIPHWLYVSALRVNQPLWYRIVVWTSAAACVLTILGLLLGAIQLRRPRPFTLARAIPYSGWMRWHYLTGAIFGLTALTWSFSGLLSMEPFAWTNATGLEVPGDALTGGAVDLERFERADMGALGPALRRALGDAIVKEIEFVRIQDQHYYAVRGNDLDVLLAASTLAVRRDPFDMGSIVARLAIAWPDEQMLAADLLQEYDSYYYGRTGERPLPVVRVKFGDPAATWVYVDPARSEVVNVVHRWSRLERWLFNGLHSLDFAFWYNRRPLWDIGIIVLLLGGLATSTIGVAMGIKRLRRAVVRSESRVS